MDSQDFNRLVSFATAIAEYEGFFKKDTRPRRNNNPGDLRYYDPSQKHDMNGFRIFNTEIEGWQALINQIIVNIHRGLTLEEFFAGNSIYPGYAPGNQAYPYIQFVAQKTGFSPGLPLANYFSTT